MKTVSSYKSGDRGTRPLWDLTGARQAAGRQPAMRRLVALRIYLASRYMRARVAMYCS